MLDKYDIEKIKDQRFYSEKHLCFIVISGTKFYIKDQIIDLKDVSVLDKETQELISDLIYESKTKCRLEKRKSHAFSKDIFLLGADAEGQLIWLEAPKWDCGWYWGFGYLESYTNNKNPEIAKDINMHQHFSGFVGYQEKYNIEKGVWQKGEYIHNVYDSPKLLETTFTEKEGWKLSELFKQFYLLKDMAGYTHKTPAGCHLTISPIEQNDVRMKEWHKEINTVMIPKITDEIMRMLTPVSEVKE